MNSTAQNEGFWVLVGVANASDDVNHMFPSPSAAIKGVRGKASHVSTAMLSDGFTEFARSVTEMLANCPTDGAQFALDEISFNLSIDASGKVAIIGELGLTTTSSVCVKWKRRPS